MLKSRPLLIAFLLLLLIQLSSFSQNNSLLWEISGNGIKKPSYLYGTIHIRDNRVFQFGDSVMPRFFSCQNFAGEIVLDQASQAKIMEMIFMPADTTLDMLLNKSDYLIVKAYAEKNMGQMAGIVDKIKPLFTSAMISELLINNDKPRTLDEYFQKIALEKGMKVKGVETVEEQMSAIDKIPLKEQAHMLVEGLKEEKNDDALMEEMINIYIHQDLDELLRFLKRNEVSQEFNKAILLERNKLMTSRIKAWIKEETYFIGVGAAHLPGNKGVIEQLRKEGFKVRPVFSTHILPAKETKPEERAGWVEYTSLDKSFQIDLPGMPTIKYDTLDPANKVITAMYMDQDSGLVYMLSTFDVPQGTLKSDGNKYFDNLISKLTRDRNNKLVYRKKIDFPQGEAMEAEVKMMMGKLMKVRLYLKEDKAVQLMVAGDKASLASASANKFINSLKFKPALIKNSGSK
jgi:uncharacterized protein